MMEMPKPQPEHGKLSFLTGKWVGDEKILPSPWDPQGGPASSKVEARTDLDGFNVIMDYVETRNGQVLSSVSKPTHTIRCRASSPARMSGVGGDSATATAQVGDFTTSAFATDTLSKLTKRINGCVPFQSTIAGPSTLPTLANQFEFIV